MAIEHNQPALSPDETVMDDRLHAAFPRRRSERRTGVNAR